MRSDAEVSVLRAVGLAVRTRRVAAELSQEDLAHATGLHRTYVGSVERGERNVSILNLYKLAVTLQCPAQELLPDR